ncbi:hypothetical protein GALMADRAFT_1236373 [Galerina marginata CBS 339.88]|uniref:Uncharacterized protein n=1 Tax=Galerina marginata (strain CBS 339.88) TaxID=685588 RepID=A0A067TAH9_GALM3|nr:hypothetical protein GALMADRAFT_1236373 [Galerina marginata CBS 339.88]
MLGCLNRCFETHRKRNDDHEIFQSHTNITAWCFHFHYSALAEGGVRSPSTLVSNLEWVLLCSVWNNMDDEKRRTALRQVFPRAISLIVTTNQMYCCNLEATKGKVLRLSTCYWSAYANSNLDEVCDEIFAAANKASIINHDSCALSYRRCLIST